MSGGAGDERLRPLIETFLAHAAVLGAFEPIELIERAVPETADEALRMRILDGVAADVEEVAGEDRWRWRLKPEARRAALAGLAVGRGLGRVLATARPARDDRFGQILQKTLRTGKVMGENASANELMLQAQALDFVKPLGALLKPIKAAVDPRVLLARDAERRRQNHVAPKRLFGRDRDTAALDRYVESGAAQPPLEALGAIASDRLRPLLVTGIGGSGKSALVADMMRRTQGEDWSGPMVVCLDFDQRNVALGGEREWLNELTRQIGFARPALDGPLSAIRAAARRRLRGTGGSGTEMLSVISEMNYLLEQALGAANLKAETLVVVVDTFEEVLVRSNMAAPMLEQEPFGLVLDFLDGLSRLRYAGEPVVKAVRAIVAGRAAPFGADRVSTARWFEAHLEVGELDVEAAAAFLRERCDGRTMTKKRAERFAALVPRFPLVLILLSAYARDRTAAELDEAIGESAGLAYLGAEAATLMLYSRFLDRLVDHEVADPVTGERQTVPRADLARLAHPGLALPVVTPRLIRDVLAPTAGLGEIDEVRARILFTALSREVWLVERVGPDAVRHVPVLRRIMLPMLSGGAGRPGDTGPSRREMVRAVHAAAAAWYDTTGADLADAAAHAAYHRAFLDEIEALSNPQVVREVLDIAGEDIYAMPIRARAILRRAAFSEAALSDEEAHALPEGLRQGALASRGARRAQAGITSRQAAGTAGGNTADVVMIESIISRQAAGTASFETVFFTKSEPEASADFAEAAEVPPSSGAAEVPVAGRPDPPGLDDAALMAMLTDPETDKLITSAFAEADFAAVVGFGRRAVEALRVARSDNPPLDRLGELTGHWLWKWALSSLAVGAEDEDLLDWSRGPGSARAEITSAETPFRLGSMLALALSTVALGRAPRFIHSEPYSRALTTFPVVYGGLEMNTLTAFRLMSLSARWIPGPPRFPWPQEARPHLLRLAALWSRVRRHAGSPIDGPGRLVSLPHRLRETLARYAAEPPSANLLPQLDDGEAVRIFVADPYVAEAGETLYPEVMPAFGLLIRARTPELNDPVRAALGDVAYTDVHKLFDAVDAISPMAPFWPPDLTGKGLAEAFSTLRSTDLVLARLVTFADMAGLTDALLRQIARDSGQGKRFLTVAALVNIYDALLLQPFDALDYMPDNSTPTS